MEQKEYNGSLLVDKKLTTIDWLYVQYTFSFLLFCGCDRIVPFAQLISPIRQLIFNLYACFGFLLAVYNFFDKKNVIKPRYYKLLLIFIVITIVSSIINMEFGVFGNFKAIVWTCIQVEVFYSLVFRIGRKRTYRYLYRTLFIFCIIWTLCIVISIIQFTTLTGYKTLFDGVMRRQGFVEQRLFGLFYDPNYAALMSITCILCNTFFLKRKKYVYYNYVSILLNWIYIVLSGSRTALVSLITVIFASVLIYSLKTKKHFILSLVFALLCVVSIYPCYRLTQNVVSIIPNAYCQITGKNNDVDNLLEREDTKGSNISNNRFDIWKSYLETMKKDYIFGKSPRNMIKKIEAQYEDSYIAESGYQTHNDYLNLFVSTGLMGLIPMAFFLLCSVYSFLAHIIFRAKKFETHHVFTGMVLLNMAVSSFFLSEIFFVSNFTSILFWICIGCITKDYKIKKIILF